MSARFGSGVEVWPVAIALGLLVVVAVNGAMAWAALGHPPQIEPSYAQSVRR